MYVPAVMLLNVHNLINLQYLTVLVLQLDTSGFNSKNSQLQLEWSKAYCALDYNGKNPLNAFFQLN